MKKCHTHKPPQTSRSTGNRFACQHREKVTEKKKRKKSRQFSRRSRSALELFATAVWWRIYKYRRGGRNEFSRKSLQPSTMKKRSRTMLENDKNSRNFRVKCIVYPIAGRNDPYTIKISGFVRLTPGKLSRWTALANVLSFENVPPKCNDRYPPLPQNWDKNPSVALRVGTGWQAEQKSRTHTKKRKKTKCLTTDWLTPFTQKEERSKPLTRSKFISQMWRVVLSFHPLWPAHYTRREDETFFVSSPKMQSERRKHAGKKKRVTNSWRVALPYHRKIALLHPSLRKNVWLNPHTYLRVLNNKRMRGDDGFIIKGSWNVV